MNYPYFDYKTILLYIIVGTLCLWSIKLARGGNRINKENSQVGFFCLFVILLLFAALRKVGLHLGGEDSQRYEESFIYYFSNAAARYENVDILFGYLTGGIRLITDSPLVYRFCCYGLISFGYVYYLNNLTPQGICSIPFVCILVPFMKSFGSMRNSMSIAFFLIAIAFFYNRKYLWTLILVICAVLTHRLSWAMLSFFPIYYVINRFLINKSRNILFLCVTTLIIISYLAAVQLQQYSFILEMVANDGNADLYYLSKGKGNNILLNWPMYIVHLLLFVVLFITYNRINHTKLTNFLVIVFFFDIIILPASLVLNLWRFSEYFYISNLILWGVVINAFLKGFNYYSTMISKVALCILFYGLMVIRLTREYQDLALMPYLFIWQ